MKKFINEYKGLIIFLLAFFIAAIVLFVGIKEVESQINIESYTVEKR